MIDFFLDTLLALFLAGIFFIALVVLAAVVKAVWSFIRSSD